MFFKAVSLVALLLFSSHSFAHDQKIANCNTRIFTKGSHHTDLDIIKFNIEDRDSLTVDLGIQGTLDVSYQRAEFNQLLWGRVYWKDTSGQVKASAYFHPMVNHQSGDESAYTASAFVYIEDVEVGQVDAIMFACSAE